MKKTINLFKILILLVFFSVSCNEAIEPVELVDNSIPKDSELFQMIMTILQRGDNPVENRVCVDFVYPFTLLIYDTNLLPQGSIVLYSDSQFSDFMNDLDPDFNISISYPIQTSLPDGTIFNITNDDQLLLALKSCSSEDIIGYCNGIFGNHNNSSSCVWEVPYIVGGNNQYAGAVFTADTTGAIFLHHHNTTYIGTWIFLFVNGELHLNINLAGNSLVAQSWNHNYKITSFTGSLFELQTPAIYRKLAKDCSSTITYDVGQTGPSGGIIAYDKGEFTNGWQYIEVAPQDQNNEEWGCLSAEISAAQYNQTGTGYQNTIAITNYHNSLTNYYLNPSICNDQNNGSLSAKTAIMETIGFKNDWFIPSVNELEIIYSNLSPLNLGDFQNAYYWSSSEYDILKAKCINFENGQSTTILKNSSTVKTRLIRYF